VRKRRQTLASLLFRSRGIEFRSLAVKTRAHVNQTEPGDLQAKRGKTEISREELLQQKENEKQLKQTPTVPSGVFSVKRTRKARALIAGRRRRETPLLYERKPLEKLTSHPRRIGRLKRKRLTCERQQKNQIPV